MKMQVEVGGSAGVILKRPYQIPISLREAVKKELNGLLEY